MCKVRADEERAEDARLEERAQASAPVVETACRAMHIFPAWEKLPPARKAQPTDKDFVYDKDEWDKAKV